MCNVLLCTSPQAIWAIFFGEWAQHIIKLYFCLISPVRATAKPSSRSQAIRCCSASICSHYRLAIVNITHRYFWEKMLPQGGWTKPQHHSEHMGDPGRGYTAPPGARMQQGCV